MRPLRTRRPKRRHVSSHGDAPRANLAHVVQFADIPAVRRLPSSGRAQDERFMAKALALAARGRGSTSPNPPVAAVVVRQHRIVRGRPFVTLKVAATLDGKIATAGGESRWITSSAARARVQDVRAQSDAILVGVGTVAADDPRLTVRRNRLGKAPLRIVLDPTLRIPIQSKVLSDGKAPTLVIATRNASASRRARLERGGAEVLVLPGRRRRIAWPVLLKELGRRGVNSLLIEGGADTND